MLDLSDVRYFMDYVSHLAEVLPKDEFIAELCRGKSVLDLGCIDHSYKTAIELGEQWLHRRLASVARDIVGLDILSEDAAELNRLGFHIEVGNVEDFDLNRNFDVVVAGDLIEHLTNIGSFLSAVTRHMHPTSLFVVTTPNPFNIEQPIHALLRNRVCVNSQHTVWLDPRVMHQLISRSELQIADFKWIDTRFKFRLGPGGGLFARVADRFADLVMRVRPICRRDFALVLTRKPTDGIGA